MESSDAAKENETTWYKEKDSILQALAISVAALRENTVRLIQRTQRKAFLATSQMCWSQIAATNFESEVEKDTQELRFSRLLTVHNGNGLARKDGQRRINVESKIVTNQQ